MTISRRMRTLTAMLAGKRSFPRKDSRSSLEAWADDFRQDATAKAVKNEGCCDNLTCSFPVAVAADEELAYHAAVHNAHNP